MQKPPNTGPNAMGIRFTSECMLTPMVRLPAGSTREMSPMVAGREIDDQEMNSTEPAITACQAGKRMTMRNPAMAMRLNTSKARLMPIRSDKYPPGKE